MNFIQEQHNTQKTWETLRLFNVISKKQKTNIPDHLSDSDQVNDFFISSVSNIVNSPPQDSIDFYELNTFKPNITFQLVPVNEEAVENAINNIKSNAVGSDQINIKMLKLCVPFITPGITCIINTAITTGKYPRAWKKSLIFPINKINKRVDYSDLRPINILPALSKVLELLVYNQIFDCIQQNSIIPTNQSGFRENHSTTSALLKVTDDIIRGLDNGNVTILLSLDYSKAFDTMNHKMLCTKFKYYGFDETTINFIKSFLTDRRQCVVIIDNVSNDKIVLHGAPQGSILAPLLFIIYTSDFYRYLEYFTPHLYADDTAILHLEH